MATPAGGFKEQLSQTHAIIIITTINACRTEYVAGEFNDGAILIVLRCREFHAVVECNAA